MKYKVLSFEIKQTKEGKDFKRLNLKNQVGEMFNGVPFWNSLPGYAELSVGTVIEGTIESTQNGQYTNHKLNLAGLPSPKNDQGGKFGGGKAMIAAKQAGIAVAQDRKEQAIDEAQTRNEVMWAKNNAAMLIAHHPAYSDLTQLTLPSVFESLTNAILNFNPNSGLTPMESDDIQSNREVAKAQKVENEFNEINADEIPF